MDKEIQESFRYYRICKSEEMPDGERLFLEIGGRNIVLFEIKGEYLATGDLCTHDMGAIGDGEIVGEEIVCPRHGARFNMRTGAVLSLPAVAGIPVYPVRITEGFIEIGIPVD